MASLMDDIIHTAESFSKNFQARGTFDYSIESLKQVDDLLDEASEFILEEDDLFSISSMIGCYIFEVARRNYGGTYIWLQEQQQPVLVAWEPERYSVSIKAWEKIRSRLENGSADSIPFFIAGYREHIEIGKTKTGYQVTII